MTIPEAWDRFKGRLSHIPEAILLIVIILLVGTAGFGLGRLSTLKEGKAPLRVLSADGTLAPVAAGTAALIPKTVGPEVQTAAAINAGPDRVVGSKSGTKYYYSSCAGANRISEANKIWFDSETAAQNAGYQLAVNCKK